MVRTDIHRPSAPEFDPEAYEFRDAFDLFPEFCPDEAQRRIGRVNALISEGFHFTGVHGLGQCSHCGAHIRYAALMSHPTTKGMIWIGEQCLGNRFSRTQAEFRVLRENAKLGRKAEARRVAAAAIVNAMAPDLRKAYDWALTEGAHPIARDIAIKLARYADYGGLTPRQEQSLCRLHQESINRAAELAAREALQAQAIASGTVEPCPEGRVTVTGEILCIKSQESEYGVTFKMLVKAVEGFKVWGTLPTSICNAEKGAKVSFVATVQPKTDDAFFGFFSRPSKAVVI